MLPYLTLPNPNYPHLFLIVDAVGETNASVQLCTGDVTLLGDGIGGCWVTCIKAYDKMIGKRVNLQAVNLPKSQPKKDLVDIFGKLSFWKLIIYPRE